LAHIQPPERGQAELDQHGERTLLAPLGMEHAEAGASAMLVACRLAGLSALGGHYAGLNTLRQWRALRGRGEDYSQVILRLAAAG
jgi:hypothetical protein